MHNRTGTVVGGSRSSSRASSAFGRRKETKEGTQGMGLMYVKYNQDENANNF